MKKNICLAGIAGALLVSGILGGCARPSHSVRPSKYVAPTPVATYGEWFVEPTSCTIRAKAAEFTLATDGRVNKNSTVSLRAAFFMPLVQPPTVDVSEILVPLPVEGTRSGYGIVLAYDPENAAHMLKPDTYLIVRYQPLSSAVVLESSFNTRGLMMAMADLAKYCS